MLGLRERQAKNLMATLLLSQGVPMLLAGDEFLRTQHGNNNAWCQDNEISWVDWCLADANADFLRFVRDADRPAQTAPGPAPPRRFFAAPGPTSSWPPTSSGTASSRTSPTSPPDSRTLAFALDGSANRPRAGPRFLRRLQCLDRSRRIPHPAVAVEDSLAPGD